MPVPRVAKTVGVPPALLLGVQDHVDDLGPLGAADVVEVEHAAHAMHVHALLRGLDPAELAGRPVQPWCRLLQGEPGLLAQLAKRPGELTLLQRPLDAHPTAVVGADHGPGKANVVTQLW